MASVDQGAVEHQTVEFDGGDIIRAFKPVTRSVHLRAHRTLERHVRDLEGGLAVIVPVRLRMRHVRSDVCCELDRFASFGSEADAGHSVVEDMREIDNHFQGPTGVVSTLSINLTAR